MKSENCENSKMSIVSEFKKKFDWILPFVILAHYETGGGLFNAFFLILTFFDVV